MDKAAHVRTFFGEIATAPMIESCPATNDCPALNEIDDEARRMLVGSVARMHVDERCLENGRQAPQEDLAPILCALDNRYCRIDPRIEVGYEERKRFTSTNRTSSASPPP